MCKDGCHSGKMVTRRIWYRHAACRRRDANQPPDASDSSHEGSNSEAEKSDAKPIPSDKAAVLSQGQDGDITIEDADDDTYSENYHGGFLTLGRAQVIQDVATI